MRIVVRAVMLAGRKRSVLVHVWVVISLYTLRKYLNYNYS